MYCFKSSSETSSLLRAYTLKHCYQEARLFQKSRAQNPTFIQAVSHCIIVRKHRVKNQTDFGYKQQLKTNILKKIHFVYLQTIEDLITFIWKHIQIKQTMFGLILVQNIEQYFGQNFQYRECGTNFLIFMKLMRQLATKNRVKGRVCFSYTYNQKVFHKNDFQQFMRSQDCTDWEVCERQLLKNGQRYQSEQTKSFFSNYFLPKRVETPSEQI